MDTPIQKRIDLTSGVRRWAIETNETPTSFADRTGYSYMHAWAILRGNGTATSDLLGRIAIAYGAKAIETILTFAAID